MVGWGEEDIWTSINEGPEFDVSEVLQVFVFIQKYFPHKSCLKWGKGFFMNPDYSKTIKYKYFLT